MFALRSAINHYVALGTTVNVCAFDLSKAFDKMNHGLFLKLMEKRIPVNLLSLIENWFMMGVTLLNGVLSCPDASDYFVELDKEGSCLRTCLSFTSIVLLQKY